MASITKRPNGHKWIQLKDSRNKRQTIRLGKCTQKNAESIKLKIEEILACNLGNFPLSPATIEWLQGLENNLHEKLAKCGLLPARESRALGLFVSNYLSGRTDLKPITLGTVSYTHLTLPTKRIV